MQKSTNLGNNGQLEEICKNRFLFQMTSPSEKEKLIQSLMSRLQETIDNGNYDEYKELHTFLLELIECAKDMDEKIHQRLLKKEEEFEEKKEAMLRKKMLTQSREIIDIINLCSCERFKQDINFADNKIMYNVRIERTINDISIAITRDDDRNLRIEYGISSDKEENYTANLKYRYYIYSIGKEISFSAQTDKLDKSSFETNANNILSESLTPKDADGKIMLWKDAYEYKHMMFSQSTLQFIADKMAQKQAESISLSELRTRIDNPSFGHIFKAELIEREQEIKKQEQEIKRIGEFINIEKVIEITKLGLTNEFDTEKLANIPYDNGLCYSVLPLGNETNGQLIITCSDGRRLCIALNSYDRCDDESDQYTKCVNLKLYYFLDGKGFYIDGMTGNNMIDDITCSLGTGPRAISDNHPLLWRDIFNKKNMIFSPDELSFVINILNQAMDQKRFNKKEETN